jgi:hypothetical protein
MKCGLQKHVNVDNVCCERRRSADCGEKLNCEALHDKLDVGLRSDASENARTVPS